MRGIPILSALLLWGVLQAPAQDAVPADSGAAKGITAQLNIQADVDSAVVFLDSMKIGETPLVVRDIRPGFHRLRIVHPDVTNWLTGSIRDSLQIQPGEEKVLRYTFGRRFLILSVPSGAEVLIDDSASGSTPYLISFAGTDSLPSISLRREGYDSAKVDLSEARRGILTVALKKLWSPDQRGGELEETVVTENHGTFRVYLAGAITVGFGAAAAYFKIQADDRNAQYVTNLSSSSASQIRVYDTASAICLVFAEVGFGFLTYFLLTE